MSLVQRGKDLTRPLPVLGNITLRRAVKHGRRRLFEAIGSDRFSRLGIDGLERLLDGRVPERGGTFVEAGAVDGLTGSNTYWLERFRDWRGVLVEPVAEMAARCRRNRPDAHVACCALVPFDHPEPTVTMTSLDVFSTVDGAFGSGDRAAAHLRHGTSTLRAEPAAIEVPARPLSAVLDDAGVSHVDFLSLDVEGYEPQVLAGLDLERHAPAVMLVEVLEDDLLPAIAERIGDRYEYHGPVSGRDHLFTRLVQ